MFHRWLISRLVEVATIGSVVGDEGFHIVLSAICSATLGYCGVLKD